MSEEAFKANVDLAMTASNYRRLSEPMRVDGEQRSYNETTSALFTDRLPWERPEWHGRAACGRNGVLDLPARQRVHLFFVERGESVEVAKETCAGCTVAAECDKAALRANGRRFGIWAGEAEKGRRQGQSICLTCDDVFEATSNGERYCSDDCRKVRRLEQLRRARVTW